MMYMLLWLVQQAAWLMPLAVGGQRTTQASSESSSESAGRLRTMADEAFIGGRADEALKLLGRVIALEPLIEGNF